MCLAQGHNAVTPMRLEPAAPRFRVMHSTTKPLRSLKNLNVDDDIGDRQQWRSQIAEKITHTKERLLDQAVIQEKNLLPSGSEFFPLRAVPYGFTTLVDLP